MTKNDIISAIETFCSKIGVAPATITGRAVGNSRLYRRLKTGGGCTVDVAERLMTYIAAASREADGAEPERSLSSVKASAAASSVPPQDFCPQTPEDAA